MKTITTVLLLLLTVSSVAQKETHDRGFSLFISAGQDIKMAYEGPYAGKPHDIGPTFNNEFKFGLDWKKQRLAVGFENHHEIHYLKYFGEFGHKFNEPYIPFTDVKLKNISLFVGGELNLIKRNHVNVDYKNWKNYRRSTHTKSIGANFEIIYKFKNLPFSLSINYNIFTPEYQDSYGSFITKDFRVDSMFNLYYYF